MSEQEAIVFNSCRRDEKLGRIFELYVPFGEHSLFEDMSLIEVAKYVYLMAYRNMAFSANRLDACPLTEKELAVELGESPRNTTRFVRKLADKGLLYKDANYVFPTLPFGDNSKIRSLFLNRITVKMWYASQESNYRIKLGALIKLSPYVNSLFNIVCKNPREESLPKVVPFSSGEILELLELPQMCSSMGFLEERIKLVTGFIDPIKECETQDGNKCYVVNPDVFFYEDIIPSIVTMTRDWRWDNVIL